MIWMVLLFLVVALPLCMRGGAFHAKLVGGCGDELRQRGFQTRREVLVRTAGGERNFIDLVGDRGALRLGLEIETTDRMLRSNLRKAREVDFAVWFVVPTRALRRRGRTLIGSASGEIKILLPDEVGPALTKCFPHFSAVNARPETEKHTRKEQS